MAQSRLDENSRASLLGASNADGLTPVVIWADPDTHRLLVNMTGSMGHDITGIADGRQTVTTAGTRVALASSTTCKKVHIQALGDNTDAVVVGGSTVVAAAGTRRGIALLPFNSLTLECDNLADIYLDSVVNGEGVSYTYLT